MVNLTYFSLLVTSIVLYWTVPRQWARNVILILASMAFLYRSDPNSLPIVLAMSVITYGAGHVIHKGKRPGLYHLLGLILLVAALTMFKYMGFLSGIVSRIMDLFSHPGRFKIDNLIMPLGISYIVFKHISYLTDIKWKLVSPGRFMDFLLYSSLFTIFVAGPIERFERFKPQVEVSRIPFFWSDIDTGFSRIVFGLFKKLVIADWLGYFIAPVWASPWQYGKWTGLLALLGYSLQIYFDFSGYSDIAIGSSRLFGIRIMENFKNPYFAPNISTFWRRWHISLSDWIRDYIFFPLSRFSKNKVWAIFFVPVIAMGLCGLWHGAAWHFVFWGLWHGVGLFIFQIWSNYKRKYRSRGNFNPGRWIISFAICANFTFVSVGWNLFR